MDFSVTRITLLILIAAAASFVQRVSGFGSGITAMMFMPYIFNDTPTAAAISSLWSTATSSYNAVKYRKNIAFKMIIPLLCSCAVVLPVAVTFSKVVPQRIMKMILGVVLVILSVYFLSLSNKIKMRPTITNGIISGSLGAALSGLFATGGPPVVLYLVNATDNKTIYFASIQFYFAIMGIYSAIIRAINGIIDLKVLLYVIIGFVGCLVGDSVGRLVFNKLNGEKVKKVIYIVMIISGILMIVR